MPRAEVVRRTLDSWDVPGSAVTVVEGIPGNDMTVPVKLADRLKGSTSVSFLDIWRRGCPPGVATPGSAPASHPHLIAPLRQAIPGHGAPARLLRHQQLLARRYRFRWTIADDPEQIPDRPTAGGFTAADRLRAVDAKRALAELYGRKRIWG